MPKLLVSPDNIGVCVKDLLSEEFIGLDTETYGLNIYLHMFSLQLATASGTYYFNFHDYRTEDCPYVWDRYEVVKILAVVFSRKDATWFIHNAKFDLHRLANVGASLSGRVHCTQAIERINYNQHFLYGLDACLKRRKRGKNKEVEKYISQHKLFTWINVEGKKKRVKDLHYAQVPFEIMFEYGCDDAEEHRFLGLDQLKSVYDDGLYESECRLVKTCLAIERKGILTDPSYAREGMEHERGQLAIAIAKAEEIAQTEFRTGPKWLRAAFDRVGQSYEINEKTSNPIFDKDALGAMQSPLAQIIRDTRRADQYVGTYYSSFLYFANEGVINANIKQAGTDTGRFSYSEPNLQNVPKEEDFAVGDIQVRKCFVPRKDHCFIMIDFDQQEYRLMLDYAGEMGFIRDIMENGLDIHAATGELCGIARKRAKAINFGLLYGQGEEALAHSLGITVPESRSLRALYFSKLPRVGRLIRDIKATAKQRGYVTTWAGRRLSFPDKAHCYKAPNHLIQGGCGDIARHAMNKLAAIDAPMLVQVHDEILFEVHKDRLDIVDTLRQTMEDTYVPMNGMKLTCGVEHSWVSWGKQDVVDGKPS